MTDATPTHAPTMPTRALLRFDARTIRATRHPVHGRLMMAKDVLIAIGYQPKPPYGTRPVLSGLKVSDANRILLQREDFDISGNHRVPTFDTATFLTHAGLNEVVTNAAAKKVRVFGPWMADVMENGAPRKAAKVVAEKPPEGLPWED